MYVLQTQQGIERASLICQMIQKCNAKIGNYRDISERYENAEWFSTLRLMYTREYLQDRIIVHEKIMLRLTKAYINTIIKLTQEVNKLDIMPEKFFLI